MAKKPTAAAAPKVKEVTKRIPEPQLAAMRSMVEYVEQVDRYHTSPMPDAVRDHLDGIKKTLGVK